MLNLFLIGKVNQMKKNKNRLICARCGSDKNTSRVSGINNKHLICCDDCHMVLPYNWKPCECCNFDGSKNLHNPEDDNK